MSESTRRVTRSLKPVIDNEQESNYKQVPVDVVSIDDQFAIDVVSDDNSYKMPVHAKPFNECKNDESILAKLDDLSIERCRTSKIDKERAGFEREMSEFEARISKERDELLRKHNKLMSSEATRVVFPTFDRQEADGPHDSTPRLSKVKLDYGDYNTGYYCPEEPRNVPESSRTFDWDDRALSRRIAHPGRRINRPSVEREELDRNAYNLIGHVQENAYSKIDLPKVELSFFSGNPTEYWNFIRQFEIFVEDRTSDPGQRLLYLINYCRGEAKAAISDCLMLDSLDGYAQARTLLRRLYGKPHVVARSLIESVTEFPKLSSNDSLSLTQLYLRMQRCMTTLKQMKYEADLNALSTLEKVVGKFPKDMQDRWFRRIVDIYDENREPSFRDLTAFVDREAEVAQNRYPFVSKTYEYKNNHEDRVERQWKDNNRVIDHSKRSTSRYINTVVANGPKCTMCEGNHRLMECDEFLKLSIQKRWNHAKEEGYCFGCLYKGHRLAYCARRKTCGIGGCNKKHHVSLHPEVETDKDRVGNVCATNGVYSKDVLLGVLPVTVMGPKGSITVNALLDNGANVTLVHEEILDKIGVEGLKSSIQINTVLSSKLIEVKICNLLLKTPDESEVLQLENVYSVERMPVNLKAKPRNDIVKSWSHLRDVHFNDIENKEVSIIIGCDQPKAHWVTEQRLGREREPFAVRTPLGWILLGPIDPMERCMSYNITAREDELTVLTKSLYNKEFEDLAENERQLSVEERAAMRLVENGTEFTGERFCVPLPWKEGATVLNNKEYALRRLMCLKRKFVSQEGLLEMYDNIIQGHISKGYIVPVNELHDRAKDRIWYMPHHPVFNPKKPNKLRIVFDCAAKGGGRSINDCLHPGPDMIANLAGVLLRFRKYPVAIMADIEEMFLQVQLPVADRDALRFLWWPNKNLIEEPVTYQMTVHPFGATSSPFCANFALRKTIENFGVEFDPKVTEVAMRDIYVDDCITSLEDEALAKIVVSGLSNMFKKGGFRMRKWLSNERNVLSGISENEIAPAIISMPEGTLPTERTLGVVWDAENDNFVFTLELSNKEPTRRNLLSVIAGIYDPLGLIAPLVLTAKIILQELCRKKLGWDEKIKGHDLDEWENWKEGVRNIGPLIFPRCISPSIRYDQSTVQLHVFADASEKGYGAAVYIRHVDEDGEVTIRLLMAKSRVAPLKTVSIPRLELSAAVLAVRLYRYVVKEFHQIFHKVLFWTDSSIVLRYINNTTTRFSTFVANRVQEIIEVTKPSQWMHVNSEDNPADLASRGLRKKIDELKIWKTGPRFLYNSEVYWPTQMMTLDDATGLEVKKVTVNHVEAFFEPELHKLLKYYSSWYRMIRAVAWLRRFIEYWKTMIGKKQNLDIGTLKVIDISSAERAILMYVQRSTFVNEYKVLIHGGPFNWKACALKKLCPVERSGLICVGGRLQLAGMSEVNKHQVILPKDHPVTTAIILAYHQAEGHAGVTHTLASLRKKYWIVQGGASVKRVIRRCLVCRRQNAVAAGQQMSALPTPRVEEGWYPFQYVGLDYFGPFLVKRGRSLERRYGCLFTCLQCRAVHIELAQTLSTDSFIMVLMRFINKRGTPKVIYSDNGTNFVGAEKELKEWLINVDQRTVLSKLTEKRVVWHFNPPFASHRGGVWERMIRSIRKILNSLSSGKSLDEESLWTYLSYAERIINDRPLTQVRDGVDEPMPLRPSDLLQPRGSEIISVDLPLHQLAEKKWKSVNRLVTEFWTRWKREYLMTLQARQKWLLEREEVRPGDLVIVEAETTSRMTWPLAIVEDVYRDEDGLVRTVSVRTSKGILKRDIRKIYVLEGIG